MKRMVEKVLAAVLGLLLMLVLLEVSLRVVSAFFWRPTSMPGMNPSRELPRDAGRCQGCVRILCAGDSFTYGFGATEGNAYPAQLQRILDSRRPETFVVINGGRGAASTTTVLETLASHLDAYPIDLVVVMAGNSNLLNFAGYLEHLYGIRRLSAAAGLLFDLRILRYGWFAATALKGRLGNAEPPTWAGIDPRVSLERVVAWKSAPEPPAGAGTGTRARSRASQAALKAFQEGVDALQHGDVAGAVAWFRRGIAADDSEGTNYYGMGVSNQLLKRYDDAKAWFRAGLDKAPDDPTLHSGLGEVLIEQAGPWNPVMPADLGRNPFGRAPIRETWSNPSATTLEAIAAFEAGIEADSSYSGNHCDLGALYGLLYNHQQAVQELEKGIAADPDDRRCYPLLVDIGRLIGRRDEFIAFLEPFESTSGTASTYLDIMRSERDDYANWIRADLGAMVELCRERDIPVVFMEYPQNATVNAILGDIAQKEGLPLVHNEAHFRDLLAHGTPFDALFVPDGHCNDQGYSILAQRVFDTLESHGLLEGAISRARARWGGDEVRKTHGHPASFPVPGGAPGAR